VDASIPDLPDDIASAASPWRQDCKSRPPKPAVAANHPSSILKRQMTQFDPPISQDDQPPRHNRWQTPVRSFRSRGFALAVILIAVVATGSYWSLSNSLGEPSLPQDPGAQARAALLIKKGQRIIVPLGSPLRGKLVIEAVAAKEIQRTMVFPSVVEADPARTVKVLSPLAGRVVSLKVQLGDHVTQGQELAVITSGDLAQAYSDDEKARTLVRLTKQVLDRQVGLEKSGGGPVKDREQAQSDYDQAKSELDRAETRLRSIGVSADQPEKNRFLSLKAPLTGSVIDLQIAPGAFLNDPTAAIMTIANLDTIWVTANIPEKDTALVVKGQSAEVVFTAYPSEVFRGKVLFVSDVLEPDTRRTKVRISFVNPDLRLKPNMFANATFLAPKQTLLTVPTTALILRNETDQVFVEVEPWVFEARPVDVGFQQDDQAILTRGLKAGERIVVKDGVLLND
jgi:cobalt-zinc-cadmium efflux system membrane fusion protein